MRAVRIIGAGPAGASAAIAALAESAPVEISEKSPFPRHKVCGEFLSPDVADALGELGLEAAFQARRPARIERVVLHFGSRSRSFRLGERAYGLSRYELDRMLLQKAVTLGARLARARAGLPGAGADPADALCASLLRARTGLPGPGADAADALRAGLARERASAPGADAADAVVIAAGRNQLPGKSRRFFGFKAHFTGPVDDAVELFFFHGCYAGVSSVEDGLTNICALASEDVLRAAGFDFDELLLSSTPLRQRLLPLSRTMRWLATGPVWFRDRFHAPLSAHVYPAGDALGFVDPFTGTGILNALRSGTLAGRYAARGLPGELYLRECRRGLTRLLRVSSLLRLAAGSQWLEHIAGIVPASWLFALTRPRFAAR